MQETWETWVSSLGQEDMKGMVAHWSILAWEILWTEEPGRPEPRGRKESDITEQHAAGMHWGDRSG